MLDWLTSFWESVVEWIFQFLGTLWNWFLSLLEWLYTVTGLSTLYEYMTSCYSHFNSSWDYVSSYSNIILQFFPCKLIFWALINLVTVYIIVLIYRTVVHIIRG